MQRLPLVLAVLVLTAVCAVVAWSLSGEDSAPATDVTATAPGMAPAPPAATSSTEAVLAGTSSGPDETAQESAIEPERETVAALEQRRAERDAIWIEGRVTVADGCALEEELEVVVTRREVEINRLVYWLGPRPERKDDGADDERTDPVRDRRPVGSDGTFRVPVDAHTRTVHLAAVGRKAYSPTSVEVDVEAGSTVELSLECGAWVRGRLTAPDGGPPDDEVWLTLSTALQGSLGPAATMQRTQRVSTADDEGRFSFVAIPAGGPYSIALDTGSYAEAKTPLDPLQPGEERELAIALTNGGRVTGRVVDSTGAGVAGAKVRAFERGQWFGFDNRGLRRAETDKDGGFALDAVLPGEVLLVADADGFLENEAVEIELTEGGVQQGIQLEIDGGASVGGHVTWPDGTPAANVEVELRFDLSQMAGMGAFNARRGNKGEAVTDTEGAFRIGGLWKGPFTVRAEAEERGREGEDEAPLWKARADGVRPGSEDLALVLEEPVVLRGRVVDHLGAPVDAFEILTEEIVDGMLGGLVAEKRDESFADAGGSFALTDMIPARWKVWATADGHGVPEPIEVELPQPPGEELVVTLEKEAVIVGVVLTPGGVPVAGAEVLIDTGGPAWQRELAGGAELPTATSTEGGTFRLAGLASGPIAIVAKADGFARSLPVTLDLDVGAEHTDVALTLLMGGTLTGEVFGDDGEPAAGMLVQTTMMKTFDTQMAFTEGDGTFRLENLDPGTWQVVAMPGKGFGASGSADDAPGNTSAEDDGDDALGGMADMISQIKQGVAELTDGEATHIVLGAPPTDPVVVTGRVMHDGRPYKGALMTFYAEGENTMQSMRNVQVADGGAYRVELDSPGEYVVQVQKIDAAMTGQQIVEFSRTVPEVDELTLDFEIPTGRVSGTVYGPDNEPLDGVRVSLHPDGALETGTLWGGQYTEATTEADGTFDLTGLRPGSYTLLAGGMTWGGMLGDDARFGRQSRPIDVAEGGWLEGEDFELERPGRLAVRVVDATGDPVSGAAVFVRDASGRLLDRLSLVTTDGKGLATYGGLTPGEVTVTARVSELASQESPPIRIDAGETHEAIVRMEAGTVVLVSLVGTEGDVVEAKVSVLDPDGREVSGMIGLNEIMGLFGKGFSKKEHRVGPLPPGRYRVSAEMADGRKVKKPVTLSGKPERKLVLRFKK